MVARLPKAGFRSVGGVAVPKPPPPVVVPDYLGIAARAVQAYIDANPIRAPLDGPSGPVGGMGPAGRDASPEALADAVARAVAALPLPQALQGERGLEGPRGPLPATPDVERLIRAIISELREELRGPRGYGSAGPPGADGAPGPAGAAGGALHEVFVLAAPGDPSPTPGYAAIVFRPTGVLDQYRLELVQ